MNILNTFNSFLVKKTFWEQVEYEITDLWKMLMEFFQMIKEVTYDLLAGYVGETVLNMFLIGLGALAIMLICLKIINR